MIKINVYPKFARNMLILLFVVFAASILFLIAQEKLGFPRNRVSNVATVVVAFLLLPLLSTVQYLSHLIEKEVEKLHFADDANLLQLVQPLLQGLGHTVRVGRYPSEDINAFAISSILGKEASIGFSTSLVSVATKDQLLAIAAHEVAHIKNGDTRNKAYILAFNHALKTYPFMLAEMSKQALKSGAALMISLSLLGFAAVAIFSDISNALSFLWALLRPMIQIGIVLLACIFAFMALTYLLDRVFFAYSREQEFAADATGATMTSPAALISALELLTDPGAAVSIFDTHPPLEERKRRLRKQTI